MNFSVHNRPPLASTAFATDGASASPAAGPSPFAGLLGAQPGMAGNAYGGSAFDVPAAAHAPTPRTPPPASAARSPSPAAAAHAPVRTPDAPAAKPPAQAGARPAQADAAETARNAERTDRTEDRSEDSAPVDADEGSDPQGATAHDALQERPRTDAPLPSDLAAASAATNATAGRSDAAQLLDWLARLSGAPAAGARADGEDGGEAASAAAADASAGGATARTMRRATGTEALERVATEIRHDPHGLVASGEGPVFAQALQAARGAEADARLPTASAVHEAPIAPLVAAGVAPTAGFGSSAPMAVALATPVTAPDFSQALASQLTTLARDGVHEAQLQLNPADMGPIVVQIVLDGSQAQIDFSAAHAATRQILEAGLPTLAAAMHAAGLTLAGGGVFEQRPDGRTGRDEHAADGSRGGPAGVRGVGGEAGGTAATVTLRTQQGLLDLYA